MLVNYHNGVAVGASVAEEATADSRSSLSSLDTPESSHQDFHFTLRELARSLSPQDRKAIAWRILEHSPKAGLESAATLRVPTSELLQGMLEPPFLRNHQEFLKSFNLHLQRTESHLKGRNQKIVSEFCTNVRGKLAVKNTWNDKGAFPYITEEAGEVIKFVDAHFADYLALRKLEPKPPHEGRSRGVRIADEYMTCLQRLYQKNYYGSEVKKLIIREFYSHPEFSRFSNELEGVDRKDVATTLCLEEVRSNGAHIDDQLALIGRRQRIPIDQLERILKAANLDTPEIWRKMNTHAREKILVEVEKVWRDLAYSELLGEVRESLRRRGFAEGTYEIAHLDDNTNFLVIDDKREDVQKEASVDLISSVDLKIGEVYECFFRAGRAGYAVTDLTTNQLTLSIETTAGLEVITDVRDYQPDIIDDQGKDRLSVLITASSGEQYVLVEGDRGLVKSRSYAVIGSTPSPRQKVKCFVARGNDEFKAICFDEGRFHESDCVHDIDPSSVMKSPDGQIFLRGKIASGEAIEVHYKRDQGWLEYVSQERRLLGVSKGLRIYAKPELESHGEQVVIESDAGRIESQVYHKIYRAFELDDYTLVSVGLSHSRSALLLISLSEGEESFKEIARVDGDFAGAGVVDGRLLLYTNTRRAFTGELFVYTGDGVEKIADLGDVAIPSFFTECWAGLERDQGGYRVLLYDGKRVYRSDIYQSVDGIVEIGAKNEDGVKTPGIIFYHLKFQGPGHREAIGCFRDGKFFEGDPVDEASPPMDFRGRLMFSMEDRKLGDFSYISLASDPKAMWVPVMDLMHGPFVVDGPPMYITEDFRGWRVGAAGPQHHIAGPFKHVAAHKADGEKLDIVVVHEGQLRHYRIRQGQVLPTPEEKEKLLLATYVASGALPFVQQYWRRRQTGTRLPAILDDEVSTLTALQAQVWNESMAESSADYLDSLGAQPASLRAKDVKNMVLSLFPEAFREKEWELGGVRGLLSGTLGAIGVGALELVRGLRKVGSLRAGLNWFGGRGRSQVTAADPGNMSAEEVIQRSHYDNAFIVSDVFASYDAASREWVRSPIRFETERYTPTETRTLTIPVENAGDEIALPHTVGGYPIRESIRGVDKKGVETELQSRIGAGNDLFVSVGSSIVKEIKFQEEVVPFAGVPSNVSEEQYERFRGNLIGEFGEEIVISLIDREAGERLCAEFEVFLAKVKSPKRGLSPRDKVIAVEEFCRARGYYDFDFAKQVGQIEGHAITEQLDMMSQRQDEINATQRIRDKTHAGVCAHFARNMAVVLLRELGFVAGVAEGFQSSGKRVRSSEAHAIAYVAWPGKYGEALFIPVDGTPSGLTSSDQARLRAMGIGSAPLQELVSQKEEYEERLRTEAERLFESEVFSQTDIQGESTQSMTPHQAQLALSAALVSTVPRAEVNKVESILASLVYGPEEMRQEHTEERLQKLINMVVDATPLSEVDMDASGSEAISARELLVKVDYYIDRLDRAEGQGTSGRNKLEILEDAFSASHEELAPDTLRCLSSVLNYFRVGGGSKL